MQNALTTLATALEIAIVLFPVIHAAAKAMPRRRVSPGQLELNLDAPAPVAVEPDPWELPVEAAPVGSAIAPLHPPAPYLLLLPPAKEQVQPAIPDLVPETSEVELAAAVDVAMGNVEVPTKMTRDQLRKACQQQGIKWRDAKGKNKHLTVAEMETALAKVAAA